MLAKHIIPEAACGVAAIDHMKNCYHLYVDTHYLSLLQDAKKTYMDEEYNKLNKVKKFFMSRNSFDNVHDFIHNHKIPQPLMVKFLEIAETYHSTKYKGIVDKDNVQIVLSSIDKYQECKFLFYCNIEGFQAYCKEYKEWQHWDKHKNQERFVMEDGSTAEFNLKNMMHCHRLLDTALEILTTGEVQVRRKNREELLSIRAGRVSYDELLAAAERKILLVNDAAMHSSLPEEIDQKFMRQLLLNLRREIYFHGQASL